MRDVIGWRAWYTNDRIFDSRQVTWSSLPRDGVLGVVVYFSDGFRKIVDGGDWYYLDSDIPTCTETHSDWDQWIDPPDVPLDELKRGVGVSDEEFDRIKTRMVEYSWQ